MCVCARESEGGEKGSFFFVTDEVRIGDSLMLDVTPFVDY